MADRKPKFIRLIVDDAIELVVACPSCTFAAGAEMKHTLQDNHVWYEIPRDAVSIEDVVTALKADLGISVGFKIYLGQFLLLPSSSVKIFEFSSWKRFITVNLYPCCEETNSDKESGLEFPYAPLLSSTGSRGETTTQSTNNIDVSNLNAHESPRSATLPTSTNSEVDEVPLTIMTAENCEQSQSKSSKNNNLNEKSSAETIDEEASPSSTRHMENDVEMNAGNLVADNGNNQSENKSQTESDANVSEKFVTSSWSDHGYSATNSCSSVFENSEINTTARCTNLTTANNNGIGKLVQNSSASLSPMLPSPLTLPSAAQNPRSSSSKSSPGPVSPSISFENENERDIIAISPDNAGSRKRKIAFFAGDTDTVYTSTPSASMTDVTSPPSKIVKAKKFRSSSDLSLRSSSYSAHSHSKENDKMPRERERGEKTKILVDKRIWREKLSGEDDSMSSSSSSTSGNAFSSPSARPGTPTPKSGKVLKHFLPFQGFTTAKLSRKSSAAEQQEELSWQPVSALDRENVPQASYVRFQYVVKENYSGLSVQEFPVMMIFDDFMSSEDGEGIRGRVIEEADVFVCNDNMKFFKLDNIQNPAIFK